MAPDAAASAFSEEGPVNTASSRADQRAAKRRHLSGPHRPHERIRILLEKYA